MTAILTFTMNPTIDISLEVDRLRDTGKNRAGVRNVATGGGGINVARGVRRLGGRATALHTAGRDVGQRLSRMLDEEDIEHIAIDIADETRQALVVFETGPDRSYHIVPPGPTMSEEEAQRCLDALVAKATPHHYVVLSGSLPPGVPDDFYARAAHRLKAIGARVILDASGPALRLALQEGVYLSKPNKREAAGIIGREVGDFDDAREANQQLLSSGSATVALTTVGALGTLCSTADGHTEVRTPQLHGEIRSDSGAGDSLVAAVTHQLAENDDPVDACALGVAAAAASLLTPGTELFRPADVRRLRDGVRIMRGVPG